MHSHRVTIRDVALLASVSRQTVSRVINDDSHVSPTTREQVLEAIEHLNFVPSHAARSLVTQRTHMVGFIVGNIGNPYFADMVRGADAALTPEGWSLILANTDYDPAKEMSLVRQLLSRSVDGLIVCDTRTSVDDLARLTDQVGVPLVLLNRTQRGDPYPRLGVVRTDYRAAATEALAHLQASGHRRIGLLLAERQTLLPESRLEAYRTSLSGLEIPYDESIVIRGQLSISGGREAGLRLLRCSNPPSAALCYNDLMAMGLLMACQEESVRVPQDLAIIGWDDNPYASVVTPPLTTLQVPRFELGCRAGEMLLKLIKHEQTAMEIELPSVLVHRKSCCSVGS